jgi:hypothetical protein
MKGQRIDLEGLAISIVLLRIWLVLCFLVLATWVTAWLVSLWGHRAEEGRRASGLPRRRLQHGHRSPIQGGP